jgi:membrane-associated phospholipid phosphatase
MGQQPVSPTITAARPTHGRRGVAVVVFAAALAAAFALDAPVANWVHHTTLQPRLDAAPVVAKLLRLSGDFRFTIATSILLLLAGWIRQNDSPFWKSAAIVFLSGVFSGVNAFLKWCFGRIRPFHGVAAFAWHPFQGGLHGLFMSEQSRSFPSGDASLAFAMAVSLGWAVPRLRALWWAMAIIVGLERMAALAHYPSDIVGGAIVGVAAAIVARWVVEFLTKRQPADAK